MRSLAMTDKARKLGPKYTLWTDIQEIVGPAKRWPHKIRKLFWTKNIRHFDRIILSAFVYVNGLNPDVFLEWVAMIGLARDQEAFKHFSYLLHSKFNETKYNLYAFNVTNNRYEYLDGTIRTYQHGSLRK